MITQNRCGVAGLIVGLLGLQPLSGWLQKEKSGSILKGWNKRWFVAGDSKLLYFHNKNDEQPSDTISFRFAKESVCVLNVDANAEAVPI